MKRSGVIDTENLLTINFSQAAPKKMNDLPLEEDLDDNNHSSDSDNPKPSHRKYKATRFLDNSIPVSDTSDENSENYHFVPPPNQPTRSTPKRSRSFSRSKSPSSSIIPSNRTLSIQSITDSIPASGPLSQKIDANEAIDSLLSIPSIIRFLLYYKRIKNTLSRIGIG